MNLSRNWIRRFIGGMVVTMLPFVFASLCAAFPIDSTNYEMPSGVLSGAGTLDATSTNYELDDVGGETGPIGTSESGSYILKQGFVYTAFFEIAGVPSIESIFPIAGARGASPSITIYGSNTNFSGTSEALFYATGKTGVAVTSTEYTSSIEVVAYITIDSAATLGPWNVHVKTANEIVTKESCFTVTESGDVGSPIISVVRFDGKIYYPGDVISSTPKITANITDESLPSFDLSSLNITIDDTKILDALGSYSYPTLDYQVQNVDRIGHGTHVLKIKALDAFGNLGSRECEVEVIVGPIQVVGPVLTYPTIFKPVTGIASEKTARIAYTLSGNADVIIYMYDSAGEVVKTWRFFAGTNGGSLGYNEVTWNGVTDRGHILGNGIYVYKITSENKAIGTGKLVVYD